MTREGNSESGRPNFWTQGTLLAVMVGVLLGVGGYTFFYAEGLSYLSSDPKACVNCRLCEDVCPSDAIRGPAAAPTPEVESAGVATLGAVRRDEVNRRRGAESVAVTIRVVGPDGAAASGADFVFCCVGNDEDLRSVTTGEGGAFDGMQPIPTAGCCPLPA